MLSIKVVVVLVLVSTSLVFILLKLFDQIPELMNYYYLFAVDVSSSDLSSILNVVASWLRPPYLYLVINCIIITIVATSKLQPKFDHYAFSSSSPPLVLREPLKTTDHHDDAFDQFSFSVKSTPVYGGGVGKTSSHDNIEEEVFDYASNYSNYYVPTINDHHHADDDDHVDKNINDVVVNHGQEEEEESEKTKILMDSMVSNDPSKLEKVLLVKAAAKDYNYNNNNYYYYAAAAAAAAAAENIDDYDKVVVGLNSNKVVINRAPSTASEFSKPPASSRFGHRKVVKATTPDQGGKALRVSSKAKRQETLESTWKTITDGRPMPLTRHLRKYDTWETTTTTTTHPKDLQNHSSSSSKMMTKSQTFSDRSSSSSININRKKKSPSSSSTLLARSSGKLLKKDPSLGQDELNKRVEAFITKFNEDMRLQRQESINQYMEMINRGAAP